MKLPTIGRDARRNTNKCNDDTGKSLKFDSVRTLISATLTFAYVVKLTQHGKVIASSSSFSHKMTAPFIAGMSVPSWVHFRHREPRPAEPIDSFIQSVYDSKQTRLHSTKKKFQQVFVLPVEAARLTTTIQRDLRGVPQSPVLLC
jgi:hypothetical protein